MGLPLITACTSQSVIPVKAVYQSQQCGIEQLQLMFLENKDQVDRFLEKANAYKPEVVENDLLPSKGRTVVVAWGHRSSSGYRLELTSNEATLDNGTVMLPVSFIEPGKDDMVAQVITTPCLAVAIGDRKGYQAVKAGDLSARIGQE